MINSGGTRGGFGQFVFGCLLAGIACWLFFDSVRMTTGQYGVFGNAWTGVGRHFGNGAAGFFGTTSMGVIFMPLAIGIFCLFVDAKRKWAWWLTWGGLGILIFEMISRVHFSMNIKTSSFILMLVMGMAGLALIFKSFKEKPAVEASDKPKDSTGG